MRTEGRLAVPQSVQVLRERSTEPLIFHQYTGTVTEEQPTVPTSKARQYILTGRQLLTGVLDTTRFQVPSQLVLQLVLQLTL